MWQSLQAQISAGWEELDRAIAAWRQDYGAGGGSIHCRAGCGNCCTLFVQTTLAEVLPVAALLADEQKHALVDFVGRQLELTRGVSGVKEILRLHRQRLGPCPFLDASASCSIYHVRPGACRALLSTRPAEWCGVDFADLDPYDRQAYLSSLDREVVAFPVHYVALTQELARANEDAILKAMADSFGLTVTGNFPLLVYLERTHQLSAAVATGKIEEVLQRYPDLHPLLLRCEPG